MGSLAEFIGSMLIEKSCLLIISTAEADNNHGSFRSWWDQDFRL